MVRVNYSSRATPGSPRVHGNGSGASSSGSVRRVHERPSRVQAPRLEHQLQADTMIPSYWPAVLPVGIVRRDPMWSRAYNGSPAGYKFVVEGGPWTWKTWLLEENLLREIEEVIANVSMAKEFRIHVKQHSEVRLQDDTRIVVLTLDSCLAAFAAFRIASIWDVECPRHVDPRGWRPVTVTVISVPSLSLIRNLPGQRV